MGRPERWPPGLCPLAVPLSPPFLAALGRAPHASDPLFLERPRGLGARAGSCRTKRSPVPPAGIKATRAPGPRGSRKRPPWSQHRLHLSQPPRDAGPHSRLPSCLASVPTPALEKQERPAGWKEAGGGPSAPALRGLGEPGPLPGKGGPLAPIPADLPLFWAPRNLGWFPGLCPRA